jgi:L-aminopeptidase/D-esterase-like protein
VKVLLGRHASVTVVLTPEGATGGVFQRGRPRGTREIDVLGPENLVQRLHGVCFAGGGAFGLAAADGVQRWLAERGHGFPVAARPGDVVPIVPAVTREGGPRPSADDGHAACEAAIPGLDDVTEEVDGVTLGALAVGGDGVIAVDAVLSKAECRRIAISAHDGAVRAGRQDAHTVFVVATGDHELPADEGRWGPMVRAVALNALCAAAADVFRRAVAG